MPTGPFDEAAARAVLVTAARRARLEVDRAHLIRIGSNAVFRIGVRGAPGRAADVVARVSPPDPDAAGIHRGLAAAAWLERVDFPAVRPVPPETLDVVQPIAVGTNLVTFWQALSTERDHGTLRELGELICRFHRLSPPPELGAPPVDPVGRARRQLPLAPLPADDTAFLLDRLAAVADRYERARSALGEGLLHGDAIVANVVADRHGRPVLIDLDLLRTGPREWDLLRTATYYRRLGWHTAAEYREFCAGYGVDVTDWPGFDPSADLAELLQIGWLAEAAARRPELAPELRKRLETVRSGGSRRTWSAV